MVKSPLILPRVLTRSGMVLLIFLFTGCVIYLNSLNNHFQYDDDVVVVRNVNIREAGNIPRFFLDPSLGANDPKIAGHYRPLVITSYAINYAVGGLSPAGYHLVNLAFHTGSAFLVFLIVRALFMAARSIPGRGGVKKAVGVDNGVVWAPLASGLIFLAHPFNAEAVNYATARSSLMSGFFYLLGFYCWVRFREGSARCYAAALLAFIAGMLSKEVVITLPVVLWLYDLYFRDILYPAQRWSLLSWRTYRPYLPFVLAGIVPYLIVRLLSFGRVLDRFQRDMLTQAFTELPVLVKHWQMFIFPRGLSLIHDVEIYHGITWPVLLSALLALLYIGIMIYPAVAGGVRLRVISFFMLWFFIVLLPTTLIPMNAIFQENRGYLAIVSFAVMAGLVISLLEGRTGRWFVPVVLSVLVLFYGTLTVSRNMVWGDSVRLWKDTVEKAPRSGLAYAGLINAYRERGDLFLSAETGERGVSIAPGDYFIRINLGRTYQLLGRTDHAIEEYETAIRIDPEKAIIWNDLAILYSQKGDLEHTEMYLKKAAAEWSDQPHIHYNLAVVLAGRGKTGEAEEEFRRAIRLHPGYIQARYELGEMLEKLGRAGEAAEQYREVVRISSGGPDYWSSILREDRRMLEGIVKKAMHRLARLSNSQ